MKIAPYEFINKLKNPRINLLGMTTTIHVEDSQDHFLPANALGRWVAAKNAIFISNNQHPESQVATLYHEVTHAVLEAIGEMELSKNEDFVEKLSRAFLQIAVLRIEHDEPFMHKPE